MNEQTLERRYQIELYLDHAKKALQAAKLNIEHGFYATAINRAYMPSSTRPVRCC